MATGLSRKIGLGTVLASLFLAGCGPAPNAQFFTTTDVALRSGQDDESSIIAYLPRGTLVVPDGRVGSECASCWKVVTPEGTGWVYTNYLEMRMGDLQP